MKSVSQLAIVRLDKKRKLQKNMHRTEARGHGELLNKLLYGKHGKNLNVDISPIELCQVFAGLH